MQHLFVVLIVVGAAAYAAWYWLPAAWRQRLGRMHRSLAEAPGCGACESSCGGCAKAEAGAPVGAGPSRRVIPIAVDGSESRSD